MAIDLLAGIRVLEVSLLSTALVARNLADLGADVIKVELPPSGDHVRLTGPVAFGTADGVNVDHYEWNRGKRSLALNLKTSAGREVFLQLVRRADVVLDGLRSGVIASWGLTIDLIREQNPEIVYATISGFGSASPYTHLPTHGVTFDATAALAGVEERADGTPQLSPSYTPIGVFASGLYGALAVASALHKARSRHEPVTIEIAAADCAIPWIAPKLVAAMNKTSRRAAYGAAMSDSVRYAVYRTSDEHLVMLQAMEDKFWQRFGAAVDRPDLLARFPSRAASDHAAGNEELRAELAAIFRRRTRAAWLRLFIEHDIAGGPVNTIAEVLDDPHFRSADLTYQVDDPEYGSLRLVGTPIKVIGQGFSTRLAPRPGQHTREVLEELLDLTPDEVEKLLELGVASAGPMSGPGDGGKHAH
jgi:crotonobetainyl-CoA:carnitine CoA-transferase CaiB-like acyl-CoA transferase